jgi:crotonobetainyl-CoA:carnitine CoA-transferase CaiB-like acyl-CoA transferase
MIRSLRGLRVIDLTANVAGPFATQLLGDMGADVVKIERPGSGDDTRGWGPPFWGEGDDGVTFSALNRNKRSLALDLKSPSEREILDRLIEGADILVQNLRPGAFERLGYSRARLDELNARLIYCEISGFGHAGPRASDPAFDPLMQAYSGLMSLTGEEGRPPARIPVSVLDQGSGMWAVIGILNALLVRRETGVGAHVTTSLLETALAWEQPQLLGYLATGRLPARLGAGTPGIAPYGAFATEDAYIVIAAANDRLWARLCAALERPDLEADPRFARNADRVVHREALTTELEQTLRTRPAQQWVQRLGEAGVPVAPINTLDQVADAQQVREVGMLEPLEHPSSDRYTLVRTPLVTDGERFPIDRLPPELDADRDALLAELDWMTTNVSEEPGGARAGGSREEGER